MNGKQKQTKPEREQVHLRLSDVGMAITAELQEKLGVNRSSLFELLLRDAVAKYGINIMDLGNKEQTKTEST